MYLLGKKCTFRPFAVRVSIVLIGSTLQSDLCGGTECISISVIVVRKGASLYVLIASSLHVHTMPYYWPKHAYRILLLMIESVEFLEACARFPWV